MAIVKRNLCKDNDFLKSSKNNPFAFTLSFTFKEFKKTLLKRCDIPIGEIPHSYCRVGTLLYLCADNPISLRQHIYRILQLFLMVYLSHSPPFSVQKCAKF